MWKDSSCFWWTLIEANRVWHFRDWAKSKVSGELGCLAANGVSVDFECPMVGLWVPAVHKRLVGTETQDSQGGLKPGTTVQSSEPLRALTPLWWGDKWKGTGRLYSYRESVLTAKPFPPSLGSVALEFFVADAVLCGSVCRGCRAYDFCHTLTRWHFHTSDLVAFHHLVHKRLLGPLLSRLWKDVC